MTGKKDTDLYAAIANREGKVCPNHDALVDIMRQFDKRLRRVEIVGIIIAVSTAGSFIQGPALAVLLKMIEA